MRAREFITEQKLSDMRDGLELSAVSLPNTYIIPELENNDFYELYRFGVALAAVRSEEGTDDVQYKNAPEFQAETEWGEKQIVTSFDPTVGDLIDKALGKMGKGKKKQFSDPHSKELHDTMIQSPIKPFKGYAR